MLITYKGMQVYDHTIYDFDIECTYFYYGYPQKECHYVIKDSFTILNLTYYGNGGFIITGCKPKSDVCNGYMWGAKELQQAIANKSLDDVLRSLQEHQHKKVTILNTINNGIMVFEKD